MAVDRSKVANRFIVFVVRNVIILSIVAAILFLVFFMSMDVATIKSLVSEGMTKRVESVLTPDVVDEETLGQFFTREYIINADKTLGEKYKEYDVKGNFIAKIKVTNTLCWPWQVNTTVTAVESVSNIEGALIAGKQASSGEQNPPEWDTTRYRVHLKKVNSKWKIDNIEVDKVFETKPTATREMIYETPTVAPVSTPKPAKTNQATPTPAATYGWMGTVVTEGGSINLRKEASTSSEIVTQLGNGTKVMILDDKPEGWYRIKAGDKMGYVSNKYIRDDG